MTDFYEVASVTVGAVATRAPYEPPALVDIDIAIATANDNVDFGSDGLGFLGS